MADTTKLSIAAVEAEAAALATLFNTGYLRIYDSTGGTGQPATVDTPIGSQVLLAELRFASTAASSTTGGVITFGAITSDTDNNAGGTATWFRALKSDGTSALWDGSVGTSGATLNLTTVALVIHAQTDVTSLTLTVSKG